MHKASLTRFFLGCAPRSIVDRSTKALASESLGVALATEGFLLVMTAVEIARYVPPGTHTDGFYEASSLASSEMPTDDQGGS